MPSDILAYEYDGQYMADMLSLYWAAKCKAEFMLFVSGA